MNDENFIDELTDDELLTRYLISNYNNINIKTTKGLAWKYPKTNLQKINPIIYKIKYNNVSILILYYKSDIIKDKKYYIPKIKKDFNLSELKRYLKGVL